MKNHTYLQRHTHSLNWTPVEFLISRSFHFCAVTTMLAFSFGSMWGSFQAMWCAVSADNKCLGVSMVVLKTVTDGYVGGVYLLPHDVLQSQLGTVLGFSRVTWTSWRFYSSRTSFAAFLLTLSSKSITSVQEPSRSGQNSVEGLCCRLQHVRPVTLITTSDKSLQSVWLVILDLVSLGLVTFG